jgi:hypothetical protein
MCFYEYFPFITHTISIVPQEKTLFENICLISSSFAPTIAILISIFLYYFSNEKSIKEELLRMNDRLLDLAMQYPHLEDDSFCSQWDGNFVGDEKKSRYNLYCCKIYNLIISLYEYCRGDYKKMSNLIDIDDYIQTHHVWLSLESDKTQGNEKFNIFLLDLIEKSCKKGDVDE